MFFDESHPKRIEVYTDKSTGGISTENTELVDGHISFQYTKGNQLQFPYTGFRLYPTDSTAIDISPYNEIHLTIHANKARHIPIIFSCKNYQLKNGKTTTLLLRTSIRYREQKHQYIIQTKDLHIPNWWFVINRIPEKEIHLLPYDQLSSFDIQCGEMVEPNKHDTIELYQVKFVQNPTGWLLRLTIWIFSIDLLCFIIYLFKLKYRVELVPIPYTTQEVENLAQTEIEQIQTFVSKHYHETITTQSVQMGTGIPKSRIPSLIKQELNTTLKQLVTSIRLHEAKRLLKESDLPVNEVADQVGFGHVSHFNRVFKEHENCTPLSFRKQNMN